MTVGTSRVILDVLLSEKFSSIIISIAILTDTVPFINTKYDDDDDNDNDNDDYDDDNDDDDNDDDNNDTSGSLCLSDAPVVAEAGLFDADNNNDDDDDSL